MNDYGVAMTMVHVVVRPVPEVIVIVVRAAVPMMMIAAMVPATMVPSAMVPSATMVPSAMMPPATVPSTTMMPSAAVRASTMVMPTIAMVPAAEAATTTVMPTAKATTSVVPTSKAAAVMPTAEAAAVMPYHAVSNQQQERARHAAATLENLLVSMTRPQGITGVRSVIFHAYSLQGIHALAPSNSRPRATPRCTPNNAMHAAETVPRTAAVPKGGKPQTPHDLSAAS